MALTYPDIDPVAISLGPLAVRWYALAYLAGFLGGWFYAGRLLQLYTDQKIQKAHLSDLLSWIIVGVLLGGRLGYVLFYNAGYYLAHPLEIFMIWEGGMAFHGGVLGAVLAVIAFARRYELPLFRLGDIVACCAPIGLFFGRIANFINGELFGRETNAPWGMVFPGGGDVVRHPSQLYEAGLEGAVLFVVMAVLVRCQAVREKSGVLSGVFLIGYGVFRGFVEFFREPDIQLGYIFGAVTMGQILCVPMIAIGLYLLFRPKAS